MITSANSAGGQVGVIFAYQISSNSSPTSFGATGLPPSLCFDPSTGLIAGTPFLLGTFNVSLSSANVSGTGTSSVAITVTGMPQNLPPVELTLGAQGSVGLSTLLIPGVSYQLQGSPDLSHWTNLGSPQTGTGSCLSFTAGLPPEVLSYFIASSSYLRVSEACSFVPPCRTPGHRRKCR